jgi:hypothetical protein
MRYFCRFFPANLFVLLRVFKMETYFQRKRRAGNLNAECRLRDGKRKKNSEIRISKSETNSKFEGSKTANQEKTFEFGAFGFVSNFGFRASNLESALSIGSFDGILHTT